MSLFRYNRGLLSYFISFTPTRLISPHYASFVVVRHATEIRSRRPRKIEENTKTRKNTVNPVAQLKKLGKKSGRIDFGEVHIMNFNEMLLCII